ncbi:MAG TPA: glycosyltransferase family 2 protein [Gallionellaceae bacterium]|nr:glycosyltransferase family 2 protein [Gallionellaceae bacterium]
MFSIVIPSWNNLEHLKLCVDSLRRHSRYDHEIIVHLNDGSDGSLDWVRSEGIKYTHSAKNVGVCLSVNHLFAKASRDWVLYMNDDMVAAPGWDTAFADAIQRVNTDLAVYFGTLIQPENNGNETIIARDFGRDPDTFNEAEFLAQCMADPRGDFDGAASQPTLVHRKWWAMLGGYSLEFSPGMSSDDDLLMKFWVAGCRNFRIVGASRFYHFGCASTGRIKHNRGGHIFALKWGITQAEFYRRYLASLRQPGKGATRDNPHNFTRPSLPAKLKRVRYAARYNYPLDGIEAWDPVPGQGEWDEGN